MGRRAARLEGLVELDSGQAGVLQRESLDEEGRGVAAHVWVGHLQRAPHDRRPQLEQHRVDAALPLLLVEVRDDAPHSSGHGR
jgi:hypothetical protein